MRIEQHPKLIITSKDIDKINEVTTLINEIFCEFVGLNYEEEMKLYKLSTQFEDAKDKLIDVFDKILCETNEYEDVIDFEES